MRDFWENFNKKIKLLWIESSKTQKILFFSLLSFVVIVLSVISILSFSTKYVPLYTNLPLQEVNQIKEELDARNIPYELDRKSTRLNSSHVAISYAVFCLKKKKNNPIETRFRIK